MARTSLADLNAADAIPAPTPRMKIIPTRAPLLLASALIANAATANEPPIHEALTCTVVSQEVDGAMRLQMRFDNPAATAIELPAGPFLVFYEDSQAMESMQGTAKLERMQRNAIHVDARSSRQEMFVVDAKAREALECNGAKPQAAALYFYKFSQRPQFRCILRDYKLDALAVKSGCAQPALWGAPLR